MRRNFRGRIFMQDDWESAKEEVRGRTRQPKGCLARPPLLAAPGTLLDAWWPPSVPPLAYKTPWSRNFKYKRVSVFRRRHGAETYRGEKPSPAGRFFRGDHLPEGEIVAIISII